jgi:NADH:ubiquinone oxidoreductase subunit D
MADEIAGGISNDESILGKLEHIQENVEDAITDLKEALAETDPGERQKNFKMLTSELNRISDKLMDLSVETFKEAKKPFTPS